MTTISAITKEIYEGPIREQLYSEVTTLKRVQRTSEGITGEVGGKYVVFPVHVSRNQGMGARLEMESLPVPGNQGTKGARVNLRYQYGAIRMSGQTFDLAKTNQQVFVSALALEMDGLKTDLAVDLNRQVYGNGTGALATVTTANTASTVFVVTHTIWLSSQIGAVVDVYDSTGVTQKASGRTITAVTPTTVTISGANIASSAIGDIFVRTGSIGAADLSTQREWTGLAAILSTTGTLYNLTDATWTANILSNSGTLRPISEGLITTAADAVRQRGGTGVSVMFMDLGVRRAYASLLMQNRRYTNTQEFTGGFGGLAFTTDNGDIPMVTDTYCPPNSIYGLTEKELKWYRESDWSFMDRDGSMWNRVEGFDAYTGYMYQYSELGTHRRNSHFLLNDLIEG